jgi:hypothetical protein
LRTAVDNDGTLDKETTSYNDMFDAFRLALKFYHFEDSSSANWYSKQLIFKKYLLRQS